MKVKPSRWDGIYWVLNKKKRLATVNLVPGTKVYGEKTFWYEGKEFRIWDPKRSKLAAAILKGLKDVPIKRNSNVLYLGAASGTTISHISDIVTDGFVWGVEIAPRVFRDLIFVAEKRKNLIPVLADANTADYDEYKVPKVDVIYQDIAQPNQAEILIKNARRYLKKNGYALFAVKSRSIDVTKKPKLVFKEVEEKIQPFFKILDKVRLEPYEKDHAFYLLAKSF